MPPHSVGANDVPCLRPQVGDGTTSVIILTGEMLQAAEPFLERNLHPTVTEPLPVQLQPAAARSRTAACAAAVAPE